MHRLIFSLFRILPLIQVCIYLNLLSLPNQVTGKNQYVLPLNMGMKVSVPYDIANLFGRFPIQGALSVVLALALNAILFFGVITAPFGYMFGIPSQKYVLGDVEVSLPSQATASKRMDFAVEEPLDVIEIPSAEYLIPVPRNFPALNTTWLTNQETLWTNSSNPTDFKQNYKSDDGDLLLVDIIWKSFANFITRSAESPYNHYKSTTILDGMFSFMPPQSGIVRSKSCDLLTVCYAHGALKRLPDWIIKIYHVFSGKLASMPPEFKGAALQGMENEGKCVPHYSDACPESPFTIVLKSYINFLPKETSANKMQKRKQAMYM